MSNLIDSRSGSGDALDELNVESESIKLSEIDFTDLYISENGHVRIRGLENGSGPLVDVEPDLIEDITRIHSIVLNRGNKDSEFSFDYDGVRYRATRIEAQESTWYTLRRLMYPIPRLREIVQNPIVIREIGRLGVKPKSGLILVSGATGTGKTTTVCSILQEYLFAYGDMAVTIEDPPELKLEGQHGNYGYCLQNKVKNGNFAEPLRSVLRQNPRYILLGEIRDPEAASEALRAAISGHVVLSTIHAGSIRETITSILKLVSKTLDLDLARQMLGDGLAAVIHQEMKIIKASDGRSKRRPFLRTLFMDDAGLKSKIREGNIQMIDTDIERQAARINKNVSPVKGD